MKSVARYICYFFISLVVEFLGLFVVPVFLLFSKTDESTRKQFTQYPQYGDWVFENFSGPWGNPSDGARGDKRGWFANWCVEKGITYPSFLAKYIWLAIRNPANYFNRITAGCDLSKVVIVKKWGDAVVVEKTGIGGSQLLVTDDGKYFRLFICLPYWFDPSHAFEIDLGWKIKLSHNGTLPTADVGDRYKGLVSLITPWKDIS